MRRVSLCLLLVMLINQGLTVLYAQETSGDYDVVGCTFLGNMLDLGYSKAQEVILDYKRQRAFLEGQMTMIEEYLDRFDEVLGSGQYFSQLKPYFDEHKRMSDAFIVAMQEQVIQLKKSFAVIVDAMHENSLFNCYNLLLDKIENLNNAITEYEDIYKQFKQKLLEFDAAFRVRSSK